MPVRHSEEDSLIGSGVLDSSKSYILRRLSHAQALFWANETWEGQGQVAKGMASKAMTLVLRAYEKNPAFFGNKSRKWILGGLFYLLGQRSGAAKTQKQIARSLGTTEMTIRASCREWLTQFPEFWSETHRVRCGCRAISDKKSFIT